MKMKKIISIVLCICMMFSIVGCNSIEYSIKSDDDLKNLDDSKVDLKPHSLDINDYKWDVIKEEINGKEYYLFKFTNNSEYDLLGYCVEYKLNDKMYDVIEREDVHVAPNQTVSNEYIEHSPEEFEMIELEKLYLEILGGDDNLYIAEYDPYLNVWHITVWRDEMNKWPTARLSNIIPKPENNIYNANVYSNTQIQDRFYVTIYDVDKEQYNAYKDKLGSQGFSGSIIEHYQDDYRQLDYEPYEPYFEVWKGKDGSGKEVILEYLRNKSLIIKLYE